MREFGIQPPSRMARNPSVVTGHQKAAVVDPGGWFAGIGTTVYNQDTTYPQNQYPFFSRGSLFTPVAEPVAVCGLPS